MVNILIKLYWPLIPCFIAGYFFVRTNKMLEKGGCVYIDFNKIIPVFSIERKIKISNKLFIRIALIGIMYWFSVNWTNPLCC